ncbi:MAG TPA: phasin family protein [Burkholderiales bacterium]|jgi:phasin family protein|nr:phasin family protein [Burkholderiales bacterium]
MTQFNPEQFAASQQAGVGTAFALSNKLLDAAMKLNELNVQAMKTGFSESQENAQKMFSVKSPQELVALQTMMSYPLLQKSIAYSRHVLTIASETRSEFESLLDAQYKQFSDKLAAFVDSAGTNAPPGTEGSVTALRSVLDAANKTYETVRLANRQANKALDDNLAAAAAAVSSASQHAA